MSEILVIGHRNPDTDSICSAIGYAEFKRRTGTPDAVAARCGDTNDRIDFVLNTFRMPPPRFVADVSPKVSDVMQRDLVYVKPSATAAEALQLMDERGIRIMPVLDEARRCRGLLSLFKLSKFLFPAANRLVDSRRVLSSLRNLAQTLHGELLVAFDPDREEELIMMIGAMSSGSFALRLEKFLREKLLVVVGDREDVQETAIREGVRVIVVTGGLKVEKRIVEAARRKRVSVISCPHDTATTAALCRAAVAVRHVLNEEFLSFPEQASLKAVREEATSSGYQVFPVLNAEGETVGILSKTDFLKTVNRKLILVDHNELSQAVQGADEVEIIEIIDHHRIGALTTSQPILFRNEPVGSTSTIVADCFFRHGVELTPPIAGLLLAGLVSDTLNLTSPTSTPHDAEMLRRLERIARVDAREFTEKLFASGSLLTLKPARQAITTDCKEYRENGVAFSVAQIEEIGFDQFWKRKAELLEALETYRRKRAHYFSALLVTDVTSQNSLLAVAGEQEFLDRIGYPRLEPGVFELRDVVSRKKQLLPYLTHCLRQSGTRAA
ncbi:MAG TPA: putative manganese-dependent inorganic diphosphatase [Verrucomicrobia bacterium]|nr:putative manganese-dependent inorganic diphosphatase [Verrucomicrobiota bacterium]HOP96656.1 putative manganese-dependent inorganic diphosphatase [Verrucomicrobiota bacterium]HPU54724.1 putative manganese-dependent inorganic diphosphatase [Verrucomicrobiota bacterium]